MCGSNQKEYEGWGNEFPKKREGSSAAFGALLKRSAKQVPQDWQLAFFYFGGYGVGGVMEQGKAESH